MTTTRDPLKVITVTTPNGRQTWSAHIDDAAYWESIGHKVTYHPSLTRGGSTR